MRKALFVGTGGASGLVVKANSKKERIAKATEKQLKLQQQQLRVQQQPQQLRVRQQPGVQQRDQALLPCWSSSRSSESYETLAS
jgi:maltodextrin utilization protein YvdJ